MPNDIPEADWKRLRNLHPIALDRFCRRVLTEVAQLSSEPINNAHQQYRALFDLLKRHDKDLASIFNNHSRSNALIQLLCMRTGNVITDEEFAQFSQGTREWVESAKSFRST